MMEIKWRYLEFGRRIFSYKRDVKRRNMKKTCKKFTEDCYQHPKCLATLVDEYGDAHGYKGVGYRDDLETKINELVRDLTKVGSVPKSEAHRRIDEVLNEYKNLDIPMGIGQWITHGIKWHYFDFIDDKMLIKFRVSSRHQENAIKPSEHQNWCALNTVECDCDNAFSQQENSRPRISNPLNNDLKVYRSAVLDC